MLTGTSPLNTAVAELDKFRNVIQMFGSCVFCDWRGQSMCPYSNNALGHPDGSCSDRVNFLQSIKLSDNPTGNVKQFMKDYEQLKASMILNNEYKLIADTNAKYLERKKLLDFVMSEHPNEDAENVKRLKQEVKTLRQQYLDAKNGWLLIWKEQMKYLNEDVNREAPKKIDINVHKTMTLEDIHSIMRRAHERTVNSDNNNIIDGEVVKE